MSHIVLLLLTLQALLADSSRPKKVLIMAHKRGGSTFLGSIFQHHPGAFYWYEPLAPFYEQFIMEPYPAMDRVLFTDDQLR